MADKSIIIVGNPDTGKSNFVGRLWLALQSKNFTLTATSTPNDIKYAESIAEHLLQGRFAPRTDREDDKREFQISVGNKEDNRTSTLIIPDVSGELWKKAVETWEIPQNWLDKMRQSSGAILFVRVHSDLNVLPLDFVTSKGLLEGGVPQDYKYGEIPTQICLIELLRFLEETLLFIAPNEKPKVAVIVTAWDLLNKEEADAGPEKYLEKEFPMFAGKIEDIERMDIKVFATSIVGGDFSFEEFKNHYLNNDIDDFGFVVTRDSEGVIRTFKDITLPVSWLLG